MGGDNKLEGRVEQYVSGVWITVCGNDWDLKDALVVCRWLDFGSAVSATSGTRFGSGSGTVMYQDVGCRGDESNLQFCYLTVVDSCYLDNNAEVVCDGIPVTGTNRSIFIRQKVGKVSRYVPWINNVGVIPLFTV